MREDLGKLSRTDVMITLQMCKGTFKGKKKEWTVFMSVSMKKRGGDF